MRYTTKNKRCLGIDPGIANTGYAVVQKGKSGYNLVAEGLITTDSKTPTGERLLRIYQTLSENIASDRPDIIAVEKCFHNKNIKSSMTTGAVIGVVQLIAAQYGCAVMEFTPQQVKMASGLGGSADKKGVQRMMCQMFQKRQLNNHSADAAACAIAGILLFSGNKRAPDMI